MGKRLVVVESPAKAKTINKILGKDFIVKASMGHVRDLPVRTIGVNIEERFAPKYVIVKGREKVISELRAAAAECDHVYLAPDPDREGEAIAWHLAEVLAEDIDPSKISRVTYNEITARAILKAFDEPAVLDMHRVDAQQARRILDRIVGYKVSPLLWSRVKRGLSAGRVQSVALRLVAEREREIDKFEPVTYWVMGAKVRKQAEPLTPFEIKLSRIDDEKADVGTEELATSILDDLKTRKLRVLDIKTKQTRKRPPPPFITSTLQQAGSRFFGFSPRRTMSLAQALYEGVDTGSGTTGLITYMRTDSVAIAQDAIESVRGLIGKTYGDDYVPEKPNFYKSRASAQEAHEAIRPTDAAMTPEALSGKVGKDELSLYRIIWERFVACQMAPAKIDQVAVEIEAARGESADSGRSYLFRASSSRVAFPGYMKVSGVEKKKKDDSGESEDELPPLEKGEGLDCIEWLSERKETQPPGRFSEASLVRALEENGVGRPSTYAATISTLNAREYVRREKRTLFPTELGLKVNDLLVKNLDALFNVEFTAKMEAELDQVEKGSVEWTQMLGDFYGRFSKWLEEAKGPPADSSKALRIIEEMAKVKEWAPPVKRGRRTYSDEKFVSSIAEQIEKAERPLSQKQLLVLAQLAMRYAEQVPSVPDLMKELEVEKEVAAAEEAAPLDTTREKLQIMAGLELDPPKEAEEGKRTFDESEFVASLRARVDAGRGLTTNQLRVLDRLVVKYGDKIPDFEARRSALALDAVQVVKKDLCDELLTAMQGVAEWKEPVKRGKREFDDKAFFESLSSQVTSKGSLTPRQYEALKRMVGKYKEQISGFDALAAKYEIKVREPKPKAAPKKKATKKKATKKKATKKKTAKKKADDDAAPAKDS